MLGDMTASEMLDELELHDVSMQLKRGEDCYFEGVGFSYHSKILLLSHEQNSKRAVIAMVSGHG